MVATSSASEWTQSIAFVFIAMFWFCIAAVLMQLYIVPWRTLKSCGALQAERKAAAATAGINK